MKRTLLLLTISILSIGAMAQPKAKFDKTKHEFGTITWLTPSLVTFVITNSGNENLIIKDVHPSCGCTLVAWTNDPIRPGQSGTISVTYDAEMLGHFEKSVMVTTNADKEPVFLDFSGDVVQVKQEYTGNYPFAVGDIHLSTDEVVFDDVNKGDMPQQVISIVNAGKRSYKPELMHLPKYISMQAVPEMLRSGRTGKIILTLDSKKLMGMGLTQTSVYVSRYPGDKVSDANEISVSAVLLPSFENVSEENAPKMVLDKEELVFTDFAGKKKVRGFINITNSGKGILNVRSLQVFNMAMNVALGKRKLAPGQSTKLEVVVEAKYLRKSKGRLRALMITNDPKKPKVNINVKLAASSEKE